MMRLNSISGEEARRRYFDVILPLKRIHEKSRYRRGFGADENNHLYLTLYSALLNYPADTKAASIIHEDSWDAFVGSKDRFDRSIQNEFHRLLDLGKISVRRTEYGVLIGKQEIVDQIYDDLNTLNKVSRDERFSKMGLNELHVRLGQNLGYSPIAIDHFLKRVDDINDPYLTNLNPVSDYR